MEKNSYTQKRCFLCQSNKLRIALKLRPTPIADEYVPKRLIQIAQPTYPLTLLMCMSCGHVQLQDIIRPEYIYKNYVYVTTSSLGLVKHFKEYATEVVQTRHIKPHSFIVELGSNDGTLLKEFKLLGMNVLGVDPAKKIARMATQSGIETLPSFFTEKTAASIKKHHGVADIICANNVVANIDSLTDFIAGIKTLLSPNGVFIFESFYLKDLIENKVFDFIFHEHISYFSVKPLSTFFTRIGMKIIDVKHIPTKGGSLRYTVARISNPEKPSRTVQQFIDDENRMGLQNMTIYKKFSQELDILKKQLHTYLKKCIHKHTHIAGYGASATSTTLLYHFQLTHSMSFLIDENQDKLHTYSPGCHIPVVSPSRGFQRSPDYVIVLAWRYANTIISNNEEFIRRGGHFIIPLPTLTIV